MAQWHSYGKSTAEMKFFVAKTKLTSQLNQIFTLNADRGYFKYKCIKLEKESICWVIA